MYLCIVLETKEDKIKVKKWAIYQQTKRKLPLKHSMK